MPTLKSSLFPSRFNVQTGTLPITNTCLLPIVLDTVPGHWGCNKVMHFMKFWDKKWEIAAVFSLQCLKTWYIFTLYIYIIDISTHWIYLFYRKYLNIHTEFKLNIFQQLNFFYTCLVRQVNLMQKWLLITKNFISMLIEKYQKIFATL